MSGIGERAFHPIPRTGGAVTELLDVLRIPDRAVVAGEDDQRVLFQLQLVQGRHHLADHRVHVHHIVAVLTRAALALELAGRSPRRMRRGDGVVEEERFLAAARRLFRQPLIGFASDGGKVALKLPSRCGQTFAPMRALRLGIRHAFTWMIRNRFRRRDDETLVLDECIRCLFRRIEAEIVIEAKVHRRHLQRAIRLGLR